MESVAERLGVTARQLRRAFTESACSVPCGWRRPRKDWGRIAADAGYYDQAHLIADFRELVGQRGGELAVA